MLEKIGPVKNPLTIIAIFAGIAEVSGTIILPFLTESNQTNFLWFIMFFPSTLVLLFFWTLNCNHIVLYAPSDFDNQADFLKLLAHKLGKAAINDVGDPVKSIPPSAETSIIIKKQ